MEGAIIAGIIDADLPQWPAALFCWPRGSTAVANDIRRVMLRIRRQPQPPQLRAALKQWGEKWFPPSPENAEEAMDELLAIINKFDR